MIEQIGIQLQLSVFQNVKLGVLLTETKRT